MRSALDIRTLPVGPRCGLVAHTAAGHPWVVTGQPFFWKISALIEERGGEEWFFGQIAEGVKLTAIARSLGCDRQILYLWIKRGEGREEAMVEARRLAAFSIVEDQDDELENARPLTPVEAAHLRTKANYRQWLASKFNRSAFGEEKGAAVVLNIGSLHSDALRVRANERALAPGEKEEVPVVEATVVE